MNLNTMNNQNNNKQMFNKCNRITQESNNNKFQK